MFLIINRFWVGLGTSVCTSRNLAERQVHVFCIVSNSLIVFLSSSIMSYERVLVPTIVPKPFFSDGYYEIEVLVCVEMKPPGGTLDVYSVRKIKYTCYIILIFNSSFNKR